MATHISEFEINPSISSSTNQRKSQPVSDEALADAKYVFQRMKTLYQGMFESQWRHDKPERAKALFQAVQLEWAKALEEYDRPLIERALVELKHTPAFHDRPPKVLQFWRHCKELQVIAKDNQLMLEKKPIEWPPSEENMKRAEGHLSTMKKMLGRGT